MYFVSDVTFLTEGELCCDFLILLTFLYVNEKAC